MLSNNSDDSPGWASDDNPEESNHYFPWDDEGAYDDINWTMEGILKGTDQWGRKRTARKVSIKDGPFTTYYKGGLIHTECHYKNNRRDGLFRYYDIVHNAGSQPVHYLYAELHYKDGKKDGISKEYCESGKLWQECTYKDGKIDGISRNYHENGTLSAEFHYKDGKKDGVLKEYCESGKLWQEYTYKDGKIDGISRKYHENGTLSAEFHYCDGVVLKSRHYDPTGKVTYSKNWIE
jgi:antitoxin component YwqK of YwqJK toxin-antitoxin module